MANAFNSGTAPKIQNLLETIAQVTGKDINLANSKSFRTVLESSDGVTLNMRVFPLDQGSVTQLTGRAAADLTIPTSGGADLDGVTGTSTLVASTKDITIAGGVPVGSVVVATVDAAAGQPKTLTAVRKNATEITVSSAGSGYGPKAATDGVSGTLVAGEKADIALANVAGDLLAVRLVTTGGVAADHFSVVRVSDALVKVQAHDAAGALVAGCTSIVQVFNFGTAAHETSTFRYTVTRP